MEYRTIVSVVEWTEKNGTGGLFGKPYQGTAFR